jgi:hypothetical protein
MIHPLSLREVHITCCFSDMMRLACEATERTGVFVVREVSFGTGISF